MGGRGFRHYSKVVWPGNALSPSPRHVAKVGRNEPCPCGSGKKYKDCHEGQGEAFLEKLAWAEDKRRRRERMQELKDQGIPWYRRMFSGR